MGSTTIDSGIAAKLARASLALDGLSVGDAFGSRFFAPPGTDRVVPPPGWRYTDDTEMGQAVVDVLIRHGRIDQDGLARSFARRYRADPHRGYGLSVRRVLDEIAEGHPWLTSSRSAFEGGGSMGNGGAMRVAPIGAYFADDLDEVVRQARVSAEVTHAHAEGQSGAIAAAVATAWATRHREGAPAGPGLLGLAADLTPEGQVRAGLIRAMSLGPEVSVAGAAEALGNGSRTTAPDTVPFALWCAARHIDDYAEALWATVSVGGDNDTNCAIVGGIVAMACGSGGIPAGWLAAREPLEPGV